MFIRRALTGRKEANAGIKQQVPDFNAGGGGGSNGGVLTNWKW